MTEEARMEETPSGLRPAGDGWFVVNVRDTAWVVHDAFGSGCVFENRDAGGFPDLGINISVVQPGQPLCLYHEESAQEDFLILAGEALLLVNGEERPLQTWDFVHSPPGTKHIFLGAGDGPCVILMTGSRTADWRVHYPVSELAARYGAGAEAETSDPGQAYTQAGFEPSRRARPSYWDSLPWA